MRPALPDPETATLPRGRHSLGRKEVARVQRGRLLRAMTDEVAVRGYASTTATGVYRRAGVSSRAFYENFTDVHDCFMAAYEECVEVVLHATLRAEGATRQDLLARLGAMLDAYLGLIASHPNVARTFLVEVYGAGSDALRRRLEVHEQFVSGVLTMLGAARPLTDDERVAVEALVDALTFRVTRHVIADDLDDPASLREQVLVLARRLFPDLAGPERATGQSL